MPIVEPRATDVRHAVGSQVGLLKVARGALFLVTLAFLAMTFVHLGADFPDGTSWPDWAKMTDEGWYSNGAIHLFTLGHWYAPETFNPSVALPVWPLMLVPWFHLFGMHMASARALMVVMYGSTLLLTYLVLRRTGAGIVPLAAVALIAINPFCYAFNRLAILEPLMVFWLMLSLWIAGAFDQKPVLRMTLIGVVVACLILTKTTGLFLVPAIVYYCWASSTWKGREWLRPLSIAAGSTAAILVGYLIAVFWSGHLGDLRLFFKINNDHLYRGILRTVAELALRESLSIDKVLVPVAFVMFLLSVVWLKELWQTPVYGASVIAIVSYLSFIAYHTKFPPRYYVVVVAPVTIIAVLGAAALWRRRPGYGAAVAVLLVLSGFSMMIRTVGFVRHPQYKFAEAAEAIAHVVRADTSAHPVLLSSSGDDITLFVGLPAINLDYSAHGATALLERYHPHYYAAWNSRAERWFFAVLQERYSLVEIGRYAAFDDPKRKLLVLYKLEQK